MIIDPHALFVLIVLYASAPGPATVAANTDQASGATATVTIGPSVPVTGNHPVLLADMLPALKWAAGEDKVIEAGLITGAEDFSYYQEHVPGLFLMLGVNDPGVPAGQAASNRSPLLNANETALITGVRALVGFSLDYAAATAQ